MVKKNFMLCVFTTIKKKENFVVYNCGLTHSVYTITKLVSLFRASPLKNSQNSKKSLKRGGIR